MSTIPSNLARVPNALGSSLMLGSITRSSIDLLEMQAKLSSGKRVSRPSDDAIGTSAISVLDDILERRTQRLRNLSHAESVLNNVDAALGDLSSILIEAKGVAASQIGVGSDAQTRKNQARIIDALLAEVTNISSRKYQEIQLFGGGVTEGAPMESLLGGLRYVGDRGGLYTDLGQAIPFPITLSADDAFGALSARVEGSRDLDPTLLPTTRLADLNGARNQGVTPGSVDVNVGGTIVNVDLTNAGTVQDVIDALQAAVTPIDPGFTVAIAATNDRLEIGTGGPAITISDPGFDATAADLGINATFTGAPATGQDIDPRITDQTRIAQLTGVTVPLGTIRLSNIGQSRDVDLSGVQTIEDLRNTVENLGIGVRVEIDAAGDRINFINELSGGAMAVAEVAGGTTATELGVRSFDTATLLADFNDGRGVQIVTGSVDPVTGLPDPTRDLDIRITTADAATFDVDFAGALTVGDVIAAINAAGGGAVNAALAADGNGIEITDLTVGAGPLIVSQLNNSFAGEDLGILGSAPGPGAVLTGQDRATVAVDGAFAHLIALRDALETNDERGISLAGEKLEADIARAVEARAEVGVRARRVTDATSREEDLRIQDTSLKSDIQDLDFTEAALRFSLLQQQLQAGLATAAQISNLSLLDFLR